jgi:hypothetical protein
VISSEISAVVLTQKTNVGIQARAHMLMVQTREMA